MVLATNLIVFGLAALAIARLVRVLALAGRDGATTGIVVLRAAVVAALCVWSLVRMVGVSTITPDALLAIVLFLVTADLAEAADALPTNRRAIAFGVLLGVGTGPSLCSSPSRSSPSVHTRSSAAMHRGDVCWRDPPWDWQSSRDRSSPCSRGRRIICRSANPGG